MAVFCLLILKRGQHGYIDVAQDAFVGRADVEEEVGIHAVSHIDLLVDVFLGHCGIIPIVPEPVA